MDVILVNMPMAAVERPALNLSLLAAQLNKEKISNEVSYLNLKYAELVGKKVIKFFYQLSSELAFGDWLFKPCLFEIDKNDSCYLEHYAAFLKGTPLYEFFNDIELMSSLRDKAVKFVEKLAVEIINKNPKIVGCTSMFDQHVAALSLIKEIKTIKPEIVTIMGGANCEGEMGRNTHKLFNCVDFVISGYCDDFFSGFCKEILNNGTNISRSFLNGRVFAPVHRKNGYQNRPPGTLNINMDDLPYPDYSNYFNTLKTLPLLKEIVYPAIPVEGSRGCSWGKCRFCGLNGNNLKYSMKSWDRIYHEIKYLAAKHNNSKIEFVDNVLQINKAAPLLEKLKKDSTQYNIFCEIRSTLSKDDIKKMKDAGFIWVQPGIESLNDKALEWMNKGTDVIKNIRTLKWCLEFGVHTVWSIMYQFPAEDHMWYNEMKDIAKLITHLSAPKGLNKLRIDRFSDYYQNQEKYNLNLIPKENYLYIYPFDESILNNLVYYFEDRQERLYREQPMLQILLGRSCEGMYDLGKVVSDWMKTFNSGIREKLEFEYNDNEIKIYDSRSNSIKEVHKLNKIQSKIYMICDCGVTINKIKKELNIMNDNLVENNLKALIDSRLILNHDDKYISLAVERNGYKLPEFHMFPCGHINFE